MPNVAAWLRHAHAAHQVVCTAYPHLEEKAAVRALAQENVVAQINHLRTHPSVAAALAQGRLSLHGWFFEIETGEVVALNGETGAFEPVRDNGPLPIAVPPARRVAAPEFFAVAAE